MLDLNEHETKKVRKADEMYLRMLLFMHVAQDKRCRQERTPVWNLVENPQDPEEYIDPGSKLWEVSRRYGGFPSRFATSEFQKSAQLLGLQLFRGDQGPYGHPGAKPTHRWGRLDLNAPGHQRHGPDGLQAWLSYWASYYSKMILAGTSLRRPRLTGKPLQMLGSAPTKGCLIQRHGSCLLTPWDRLRRQKTKPQASCDTFLLPVWPCLWTNQEGQFLDQTKNKEVASAQAGSDADDEGEGPSDFWDEISGHAHPDNLEAEMLDQAALEACEEDAYAMSPEEKECAVKGLQWKEVVFTEMMKKKIVAVEQALVRIIAELTQLGLPISRFHSDSGTDFVSPQMRKLVTRLNMKQTCSAPEEHNSTGRIENIVGRLKGQMRAYLHSPGADVNMWPISCS